MSKVKLQGNDFDYVIHKRSAAWTIAQGELKSGAWLAPIQDEAQQILDGDKGMLMKPSALPKLKP